MQSTMNQYGAPGFPGLLDGIGPKNVRSYAAEEVIPFGHPVRLGTNKEQEVLKATTGANAIGFTLHDHAHESTAAGVSQYDPTETSSVLTMGRLWVKTSGAVTAGDVANLTVATGTLTGAAVAAGIEAFTQINVRFITSTTAAGIAIVGVK